MLLESCAIKFQVIMLSEAWDTDECNFLVFQNYRKTFLTIQTKEEVVCVFRCCPALLLASSMNLPCPPHCEILKLQSEKHIFCVRYRTQQSDIGSFFAFLENFLDSLAANRYILLMSG